MATEKFGFRIVNVDIVYKAMAPRPAEINGELYAFEVFAETSVHKDQQLVFTFVKTNIREENGTDVLAAFTVVCVFSIADFEHKVILNKDGLYEIDQSLENALKNFSIGTTRGVLWSELKGSYLHNVLLPVIDISTLSVKTDRQIFDDDGKFKVGKIST
ncbi:MAG: hypothetical protein ACTHMC_13235 [Pseudobacter sp.]|uniref:hypothetical protein n=1 Tax=Pseudobacter sp. TaxID=2045420 RepID=UPI003F7D12CD